MLNDIRNAYASYMDEYSKEVTFEQAQKKFDQWLLGVKKEVWKEGYEDGLEDATNYCIFWCHDSGSEPVETENPYDEGE